MFADLERDASEALVREDVPGAEGASAVRENQVTLDAGEGWRFLRAQRPSLGHGGQSNGKKAWMHGVFAASCCGDRVVTLASES